MGLSPTTLYLVRHGQSQWNIERRIQGQTPDIELTDLGREQAAAVAADLRATGARHVISSDLVRARQTAEPIATALGVPLEVDPDLREQAMGEVEGRYSAEVLAAHPDLDWTDATHRFPGGESRGEVFDRMARALTRAAARPGPVVVVSHGDAIRLALSWAAGRHVADVAWQDVPNCSIWTVQIPPDRTSNVTPFSARP